MPENRTANRLPYKGRVRIRSSRGPIEARFEDLSRGGFRLRIRVSSLGAGHAKGFVEIATYVKRLLGTGFQVELGCADDRAVLEKAVSLVRLMECAEDGSSVEFGCAFDVPLNNQDTDALGVVLPPLSD